MRHHAPFGLALLSFVLFVSAIASFAVAQEPKTTGYTESVGVRLILLEALVLDENGRTVPDLEQADFSLAVDSRIVEIESLDLYCPAGAIPDVATTAPERPTVPSVPRRIVLLLDYHYLVSADRVRVLDEIEKTLREVKSPDDEVMIAALAEKLRVEQRFTKDLGELLAAIDRLNHDSTLFGSDLRDATPGQYIAGLATMMDVLEPYTGAKALVLYSGVTSTGGVTIADFEDIARRAASARTTVYPAVTKWMKRSDPRHGEYRAKGTAGGVRILPILAVGTGGEMPPEGTDDLSISYARAQRDLACRYTVGFKIPANEAETSHKIGLSVKDYKASYPVRIRLWSEEERRVSRLRAAFADPENFDEQLVRAGVFAMRPTGKTWDSLVALHFPMPVDGKGNLVDVRASLTRAGGRKAREFDRQVTVPVPSGGVGSVPVAMFADAALKPGDYEMTIALSRPERRNVVTTRVGFHVPDVPRDGTFLRGPVMARVRSEGVLMRIDDEKIDQESELARLLNERETVELLLVHEIKASDTLLTYWSACAAGKGSDRGAATVHRQFLDQDGQVAYGLDPIVVQLEKSGKVGCGTRLDQLPPGSLAPGKYRFKLTYVDAESGDELHSESTPLLVR